MKKKILVIFLTFVLVTSVLLTALTGCFGSTVAYAGWAGVTIAGGKLYTVSGLGQLYALTVDSDGHLNNAWDEAVDTTTTSGSFLGCAASSTAVPVYGDLAVAGEQIYIAGYYGKVYIFNATTHLLGSSITLDSDDNKVIVGGPVVEEGKVFIASSNGNLYALDSNTLARLWKFGTGDKIWSTPAVDNGTVFIGSFDKKVYAVDAATGEQKWAFTTQGAILATPVIDNGTVYVASFDRHIYALDEATGELKWQFPALGSTAMNPEKWFWASPVLVGGIVYAPCMDGNVYAVKAQDGSLVMSFDLGSAIPSSPVVVDGRVIVATDEAKIYSLDAASDKTQLLVDLRLADNQSNLLVNSQLSAANGIVYIHGLQSEKVYALNVATGKYTAVALESVTSNATATATVTTTVTVTATK